MYAALQKFRERYGHCRVPYNRKKHLQLSRWVSKQRTFRKRGTLSKLRQQRLDELGFWWGRTRRRRSAEDLFDELERLYTAHGHCDGTRNQPADSALLHWVSNLRRRWRCGTLPAHQERRLRALQFDWEPRASTWEKRFIAFRRLLTAQQASDNATSKTERKALSARAVVQRLYHRDGKLSAERFRKLDSIGFNWELGSCRTKKRRKPKSERTGLAAGLIGLSNLPFTPNIYLLREIPSMSAQLS